MQEIARADATAVLSVHADALKPVSVTAGMKARVLAAVTVGRAAIAAVLSRVSVIAERNAPAAVTAGRVATVAVLRAALVNAGLHHGILAVAARVQGFVARGRSTIRWRIAFTKGLIHVLTETASFVLQAVEEACGFRRAAGFFVILSPIRDR